MYVSVEPLAGSELERLITALVNATGCVHRVIEGTKRPPDADGAEVIGVIAEHLRAVLTAMAEHRGDEELAVVTGVLAEATLLIADDLGLSGLFAP